MFQPALSSHYIKPSILMDDHKLKVVDKFICLECTINRCCTLDVEISVCVKKATDVFTTLKKKKKMEPGEISPTLLKINF